jgi:four helix bundle protein
MNEQQFKDRTKELGLRVVRLVEALPAGRTADVIAKQILRSATSVGANYRAACRGKSAADMISKLDIVLEEADETLFWLEIIVGAELMPANKLRDLMAETSEIVAMTVTSLKTLRANNQRTSSRKQHKSEKLADEPNLKSKI